MLDNAIGSILSSSNMCFLEIERETVDSSEVFHDQRVSKSLLEHSKVLMQYEKGAELPASIVEINNMSVPDSYLPEELSHQKLTGCQVIEQAKLIKNAPFLRAVTSHPDFKELPGYEKQRRIMRDQGKILNLLRGFGNLFRNKKIHTMLGSRAELTIAHQCFGTIWPAGVNLYSILREMYPAFHARVTGQIPVYVADNFENLLDSKATVNTTFCGIARFTVDDDYRFQGLYPVAEVPEDEVTLDSQFISQDQLGRMVIASRMLDDAISILQKNNDQRIVFIDYAGGVGNISELLLKEIYAMPEGSMKLRLMNQLRIVVIDVADDQLAAGENRFSQMEQKLELKEINDKIIFLKGDVTKPLSEDLLRRLRMKFGEEFLNKSVFSGMTSYTIGALDNLHGEGGKTYAEAMADEMYNQCWKIYAVDFSSPMWRLNGFLRDTGKWGIEYMRSVHGVADQQDKDRPLNRMLAVVLKLRYGLEVKTVADFVKFMALGPGLASHYSTVWPDSDGHNSGYTVLQDGALKKPSILSFAERLQGYGSDVYYKSKVMLFGAVDIGRASKGKRTWAFIPGSVADFVVAENIKNRPAFLE
ncbi:MAG: hypothetical protein ACUZ8O_16050 [Candidatus Anammoxibacter sp.]